MAVFRALAALLVVVLAVVVAPAQAHERSDAHHSLRQAVTDQSFYFVMADRFQNGTAANDNGGLPPGKDEGQSGFDPTGKGWYHGGDLQGLRSKLGYIKRLGTTAIWLTPSFKNKAVQDNNGFPSAGYHGYWITDFTQIDPHLGTNDELAGLIRDAHRLGVKVYFDVITNHTADVIRYGEGAAPAYISKDQYPYRTASGTVSTTVTSRARVCSPRWHRRASPRAPRQARCRVTRITPACPRREGRQGPGLAQRREPVPQPRQHDVRRRELAVRRLLRAR